MALFEKFIWSDSKANKKSKLIEKILVNLNNTLNTRKHYGTFVETLGLTDFSGYKPTETMLDSIRLEIKNNIEHHEPRMRIDTISLDKMEKPALLYFRIECQIDNSPHILNMIFNSSAGNIKVQRRS
ncbi:MAG: type VI secretion system baseplate subunit TssE [candidate division Zixibacteria bacterium]|nr:type VI secretion system baseplate subunit TssE [candidate division Zixibacteria bacterium]